MEEARPERESQLESSSVEDTVSVGWFAVTSGLVVSGCPGPLGHGTAEVLVHVVSAASGRPDHLELDGASLADVRGRGGQSPALLALVAVGNAVQELAVRKYGHVAISSDEDPVGVSHSVSEAEGDPTGSDSLDVYLYLGSILNRFEFKLKSPTQQTLEVLGWIHCVKRDRHLLGCDKPHK